MSINSLENSSLIKIKKELDSKFGIGEWFKFEPETISLEYNEHFSPLLLDKISLLRVILASPLQAYYDPALFLYAAEVINNTPADFQVVPHLTLLETAYAIISIDRIIRDSGHSVEYLSPLKKAVSYILNLEGLSVPIYPFEFIDATELSAGQTDSDTAAKEHAIYKYVSYMDSL